MLSYAVRIAVGAGSVVTATLGLTGCGLSSQVAAAPSTTTSATTTTAVPTLPPMKSFRIGWPKGPTKDCSIDGPGITCSLSVADLPPGEVYTGTVTGTISGLTFTGTATTHQRYREEGDPECIVELDETEPVEYVFSLDGMVTMHGGPADYRSTRSGSCSGTDSGPGWRWEDLAPWTATG